MWWSVRKSQPPKRCFDEVGEGVAKRRRAGGLAEAHATARVRRPSSQGGGGADDRLDRPKQEDEPMDYERLAATSEAFIYVAMSRLMLRRLARS
jgi:hypothetical protein